MFKNNNYRSRTGAIGENRVAEILLQNGFKILGQQVHTRYGELDIIAQKDRVIHVIEVKARRSGKFGTPEQALTKEKFRKIVKALQTLRQRFPALKGKTQIDLAAVTLFPTGRIIIKMYWNVGWDDLGS